MSSDDFADVMIFRYLDLESLLGSSLACERAQIASLSEFFCFAFAEIFLCPIWEPVCRLVKLSRATDCCISSLCVDFTWKECGSLACL